MNRRNMNFKLTLTGLFIYITLLMACEEDGATEVVEPIDEDMVAATQLANEYLNSVGARGGSKSSITVLKFKEGKLFYATNSDDVKGYQELTEESVTASVNSGEFIFWYSGGGVTDLEGIDFDDESEGFLGALPDEINRNKMWTIVIPDDEGDNDDDNDEVKYLKYDIIYDFKGNTGDPIRLDPKLVVGHSE